MISTPKQCSIRTDYLRDEVSRQNIINTGSIEFMDEKLCNALCTPIYSYMIMHVSINQAVPK